MALRVTSGEMNADEEEGLGLGLGFLCFIHNDSHSDWLSRPRAHAAVILPTNNLRRSFPLKIIQSHDGAFLHAEGPLRSQTSSAFIKPQTVTKNTTKEKSHFSVSCGFNYSGPSQKAVTDTHTK